MLSNAFFKALAERKSDTTVSNPYREAHLLRNLKLYFDWIERHSQPLRFLLVGEALGHKGGRQTGVPFTSSALFHEGSHALFRDLRGEIRTRKLESETTASIIWDALSVQTVTPLLWNAFPFHPHKLDNPQSNRTPKASERDEGRRYLTEIVRWYQPDVLAAVGRKGFEALSRAYPEREIYYIRHPSFGGKSMCLEGLNQLFKSH